MKKISKYVHHGREVNVIDEVKGKNREHCLCFQDCKYFFPDDRNQNCSIANTLYNYDKLHGLVTPVYECPIYENK